MSKGTPEANPSRGTLPPAMVPPHETDPEAPSEARLSYAPMSVGPMSLPLSVAVPTVEEDIDEDEGAVQDVGQPYDPSKTHIVTKSLSLDLLLRRLAHGEIDLQPEFQRKAALWSPERMSRLVESILIRIPLPVFYFDASDDAKWLVIDGLQRLGTFDAFAVKRTLRLVKLEYLQNLEGKLFTELSRDLQRRIEETQVAVHLVQPGTPSDVKYNIFRRINTGGVVLTPQEIRHALHQGKASAFLGELARDASFLAATGGSVDPDRMLDREFVLRFVAFSRTAPASYSTSNLDLFLTRQMAQLQRASDGELTELRHRFGRAMNAATRLFGEDAFRKRYEEGAPRHPINKALFEAWSVALGALDDGAIDKLVARRSELTEAARQLLATNPDFEAAISQGTAEVRKVQLRFGAVAALIGNLLAGDSR
jgi:hypothetical protein